MMFHLPLLKTSLLWLATAASLFGIAPQFECICPNGSKQTLLFTANANCCAKRTVAVAEPAKATAEGHCPKCHPPKSDVRTGDAGPKCSESSCKKSMVATAAAVVPTSADLTVVDAGFVPFMPADLPFHIVHSHSLNRSPAADQSLPPPDLVIVLRHLVI